jgi:3-phenylpropionate/trans-cinnamate dioxygenase ferredoxin reductase subunit
VIRNIVIVGAGHAGSQAAATLRQFGFSGAIKLVGEEPVLPYQRPPLSKAYLLAKTDLSGLLLRPAAFYDENAIDLINTQVVRVDRAGKRVLLGDGRAIDYDHLVLATGARNRALPVIGSTLQGVRSLRDIGDADALAGALKPAANVVVVGAGFIGLEFAAVANQQGKKVHVVELADRPMARAVSREMAGFFSEAHRGWGVHLHFGKALSLIGGAHGKVVSVELVSGEVLSADLVVVGIGVLPDSSLASQAGLDVGNGIIVNAGLLTSDSSISAIGDCACFPGGDGRMIRIESVQNATDQGRAVAARITGNGAPYAAVPWFWTDQGDIKLQIAGLGMDYDATLEVGSRQDRCFSLLLFREGRLIASESVNRTRDFMAVRKILASGSILRLEDASAHGFDLHAHAMDQRDRSV